jgi:hypothetical protein
MGGSVVLAGVGFLAVTHIWKLCDGVGAAPDPGDGASS